ncbi:MAG TPA: hypothetical protein VIU64_19415 [Polyangia bacterium]
MNHSTEPRSAPRDEAKARLCVVLGCHRMVCALPIDNIDRLVLPDAVEVLDAPAPATAAPRRSGTAQQGDSPGDAPVPDVVRVAGKSFAAWDLGVLLGQGPVQGAWVLLSLIHDGADLALALRTGPCYSVQSLRNLMRLPGEVFQERRGALTDGFATSAVRRADLESNVGVLIDPKGLWTRPELQMSAAVLEAAGGRGQRHP